MSEKGEEPRPGAPRAGGTAASGAAAMRTGRVPRHFVKPFLVGVVVAFCALVLVLLLKPAAGPRAGPAALLPVQRQPFAAVLHESGTIEALNETVVLNRFSGDIIWKADDGKLVEAGEPIIRFETKSATEDIEAREKDLLDKKEAVRRARVDIAATQQRYEHSIRQAEIQLELAVLERKRIHDAPTADEKLEAELSLQSAALDLERSEVEMKSYEELARRGFVSEAKRKEKQLDYATKKANHAKTKLIYDLTLMGYTADAKCVSDLAVADARKRLNIAKFNREADLAVCQAACEVAEVGLDNFERDLKRRRQNLEWGTVRAPARGHVVFTEVFKGSSKSRTPIQVGESRTAGADLCMICDTSALRIRVWVNEADVKNATLGQRALVRLPALPGRTFEAVVSELAVLAMDKNVALSSLALRRAGEAFVNVVQAKLDFIALPEADRKEIRVGFTADVHIQITPVTEALTVPWLAVRYDRTSGEPFAEAAAGRGRVRRALKLGRSDAYRVEVLEGLSGNDQVYDQTGAARSGIVLPAQVYCQSSPSNGGS